MSAISFDSWAEANWRYLRGALDEVRAALASHLGQAGSEAPTGLAAIAAAMPVPPALETLCATFGLGPFERAALLLCAGAELDPVFGALVARAEDGAPTLALALAALPEPDWRALTPAAPLRRWRLIELLPGPSLTRSQLRIDERILHHLAGIAYLDERIAGFLTPVAAGGWLTAAQRTEAERLNAVWSYALSDGEPPIIQLVSTDSAAALDVAAAGCAAAGLRLYAIAADAVPLEPREQEALARLWEREALLSGCALLVDCGELDGDLARERAVAHFVESIRGPLLLAGREQRGVPRRPLVTVELAQPRGDEQRELWRAALEGTVPDALLDAVQGQFTLGAPAIRAVCAQALGKADPGEGDLGARLWEACRQQARPRLDALAQRIEPAARWEDLVLPGPQLRALRLMAAHVRRRRQVHELGGFAAKSGRGLGISALFAGPSGTGKTMAAEVLAGELRLDLYKIDLSQVVSKYIGETEKNLRRVFDAAEGGGAILLFDEADALFGKRSEVKDSHDRYANVEISYLLQRMEQYHGLAILTTNMRQALDPAFLRRIRFLVQFPFPDAPQRAEIWRRVFPAGTATEGLDPTQLARLSVAGGGIRNIALGAAFLAAEDGTRVRMEHLAQAAKDEYAKVERQLSDAEIRGWCPAPAEVTS